MRQLYRTETCITLFALTSLISILSVSFSTNGFKDLFLYSFPWKWETGIDATGTLLSDPPHKTAIYPNFTVTVSSFNLLVHYFCKIHGN